MDRRPLYIALLVAAMLLSCDNTIDPIADSDARAFSVFGYLDLGADTQFVRVTGIRPEGAPPSHTPEVVATRNLASGEEVAWMDSVVTLDDGTTGHLFFAVFTPQSGETYAMEVRAVGVRPLRAFTRVPPDPSFEVESARVLANEVFQMLTWEGVRSPGGLSVRYWIRVGDERTPTPVDVPYDRRFYSASGDQITVSVNLSRDFDHVSAKVADPEDAPPIQLSGLEATVRALSPEWDDQTAGTNIENGEGFFASVGEFTVKWNLPDSLLERIGYAAPR